jgi:plastocyanin
VRRFGLAAVAALSLWCAVGAMPAAAQEELRECTQTGSSGTKKTFTCRYGPVTVGPYQVVSSEFNFDAPVPNVDGHITAMETDVVDADGTPIPINRLMLHHIVFSNRGQQFGQKRDRTCGSFLGWDSKLEVPALAERFYAAGEERAKMHLPEGFGYPHSAENGWVLTYMFMNHRNRVDTGYIQYTVTIDTAPGVKAADPYWLDVENCKVDPVYDVPGGRKPGSTHRRSSTWTAPTGGRIIAAGGHVHGGGQKLALRRADCTTNQRVYTSKPVWGSRKHPFYNVKPVLHEPGPIHMTGFSSAQGYPVASGERIALDSIYDASLPHTRVMGILVMYFVPDASVTAKCGPPPTSVAQLPKPKGRTKPPRFTVPIVGMRKGRAVNIRAPKGKRVKLGRRARVSVGDLFFRKPNIQVRKGSTVTWRFNGSTLHNITVANGPRGFSSANLNDGRRYKKKLSVPGTYKLFCGLHPVDMTATVKVTAKRKRKR